MQSSIVVEVVYALPDKQVLMTVHALKGATISDVIISSGILSQFPEIDLANQSVGIFGQVQDLSTIVQSGDRVEIYRPLEIDPKDARRLRIQERKKT